jgi:Ca2+-binding EF-hand superfamily protein
MKTALIPLCILAICCMFCGVVAAQDKPAAKPKTAPNKQAQMAEKNFKALDKDQDGVLTCVEFKGKQKKAEAIEKAEQIFKLIDADGDLKVTWEEFKNKSAEARFKQMDKDGDGKVTFEEFKGRKTKPEEVEMAERFFKRMDANGDKAVTLEELKAARKKQAEGKKKGKKPAKKKFQPEVLKAAQ